MRVLLPHRVTHTPSAYVVDENMCMYVHGVIHAFVTALRECMCIQKKAEDSCQSFIH